MPINMSVEYPKLQSENIKLKMINDSLLNALKLAEVELKKWHKYNLDEVESFRGAEADMQLRNANDIYKLYASIKESIKKAEQ